MTKEITETDFVNTYSEKRYQEVVKMCYENMSVTPEWKNNKPFCHSLLVFPWDEQNGKKTSLIIEANAKKITISKGITAYDFGIVKISISDEDMPDEVLDRYNEIMKTK